MADKPLRHFFRTLVQDYGWIHLGIGLSGNFLFAVGSVMFLPDLGKVHLSWIHAAVEWKTVGVWLFIIGATLMLVGSIGSLLLSIYNNNHADDDEG